MAFKGWRTIFGFTVMAYVTTPIIPGDRCRFYGGCGSRFIQHHIFTLLSENIIFAVSDLKLILSVT